MPELDGGVIEPEPAPELPPLKPGLDGKLGPVRRLVEGPVGSPPPNDGPVRAPPLGPKGFEPNEEPPRPKEPEGPNGELEPRLGPVRPL